MSPTSALALAVQLDVVGKRTASGRAEPSEKARAVRVDTTRRQQHSFSHCTPAGRTRVRKLHAAVCFLVANTYSGALSLKAMNISLRERSICRTTGVFGAVRFNAERVLST